MVDLDKLATSAPETWPYYLRTAEVAAIARCGVRCVLDAIREGKRGTALLPRSKEAWRGASRLADLARIYTQACEPDAAIDLLEELLSRPGHLTPALLATDPVWIPLRGHPRFGTLISPD